MGARHAGSANAYSVALFVGIGPIMAIYALIRRGPEVIAAMGRHWGLGLAGGTLQLGAYGIAIWAMTVAPTARQNPGTRPELRIPGTAAQTRMVSAGEFWPSQRQLSRYLKYMARARISEFESSQASHAVWSPPLDSALSQCAHLGQKTAHRQRKRI